MKTAAASALWLALVGPVLAAGNRGEPLSAPPPPHHPFLDVYRITQHPRCMNCHPAGDAPLHGDDSHPHSMGVKRGPDGKGLPEKRCTNCHTSTNQVGAHKPPGAPDPKQTQEARWHLPSPHSPLVFQGKTPAQLCRQLLDRKTNGGLEPASLIAHVQRDPFVRWAWQPGEGRKQPPGSHERFVYAVLNWIADGHSCPAE